MSRYDIPCTGIIRVESPSPFPTRSPSHHYDIKLQPVSISESILHPSLVLSPLRLLSDSGNFIHGGRRHSVHHQWHREVQLEVRLGVSSNSFQLEVTVWQRGRRVSPSHGRRPGPRTLRIECGPLTCDLAVISFELIFALKSSHPHGGESESTF